MAAAAAAAASFWQKLSYYFLPPMQQQQHVASSLAPPPLATAAKESTAAAAAAAAALQSFNLDLGLRKRKTVPAGMERERKGGSGDSLLGFPLSSLPSSLLSPCCAEKKGELIFYR